jgi:RHS repeat-associated protein
MGEKRGRALVVILAAVLGLGIAAPASASFTTRTSTTAPPLSLPPAAQLAAAPTLAAPPFAASVEPPSPSPGMGLSASRTPTGPRSYFGARYYQAKLARFTTVDPVYTWRENLVDPQRWNRYAYGRNNPLRYVDPDGRAVVKVNVPPPPRSSNYLLHSLYQLWIDFVYLAPPAGVLTISEGSVVRGVTPFQTGKFKDLKRWSLSRDGLDIDHQPSRAAMLEAAQDAKGGPLTATEARAVVDEGSSVAVPEQVHRAGPTYGGRNTPTQIAADKADLRAAAARDADAMVGNAAPKDKAAAQSAAERIKKGE